ncbi:hypothetical protein B0H14DRAFT_2589811 [Mycena olivaceomarginata]|nr:hypothetical protein B0H14DRAFT_2589811 [Mycena olivaceomarginata]
MTVANCHVGGGELLPCAANTLRREEETDLSWMSVQFERRRIRFLRLPPLNLRLLLKFSDKSWNMKESAEVPTRNEQQLSMFHRLLLSTLLAIPAVKAWGVVLENK